MRVPNEQTRQKQKGSAFIVADFLISLRADTPDSDAFNPDSLLSEAFPPVWRDESRFDVIG
jgi:hypothetical protein